MSLAQEKTILCGTGPLSLQKARFQSLRALLQSLQGPSSEVWHLDLFARVTVMKSTTNG
jgi:hypothetical protein